MDRFLGPFVDATVQCWGCPVFDRLFQVISGAAGAIYRQMVLFCILLFCVFIAFYILYAVWDNIKGGVKEPTYETYFKPVLINGLIVMSLFSLGVWFPRFITSVTIEPITEITVLYTQSVIGQTKESVNEKVTYHPRPMHDDGFYRPELRDKIIMLIKTSVTQFQAMMKLGLAVMDRAFSWDVLMGNGLTGILGNVLKHIIIFFMGLYLVYAFFKLFVKFSFFFIDSVVHLTFYAFFFPISLLGFVFKNSKSAGWITKLADKLGPDMLKKVINSIVTLATAVITYVIIMVIIAKFFAAQSTSGAELARAIMDGSIYSGDLSGDNLNMLTLAGCIVLVYLVTFLTAEIPKITRMITTTFGVDEEKELGEAVAKDAEKFMENAANLGKNLGGKIMNAVTGKTPATSGGGGGGAP